ncbi:hypothetical protein BDV38DRAFT_284087 [Aspergillus pseudotamarii]|uniref:Secreted protein n=1 Tax=Aspergillus pseudotamarii TaxID=132259 RepID=A0A5N6SRF3_ASPPS|nr:uncharacterized protein BDV38DRAFT_284087 [Aspergillus pseudotamarii]KAE8136341.1 hypothetical protein BDV38DRAFT_284087 [Aspergillus pseudotamarii]
MKFIYILALIAPAVLAAPQATENKQSSPATAQCLDIAKGVHQTDSKAKPNLVKDLKNLPACNPFFQKCTRKIDAYVSGEPVNESNLNGANAADKNAVVCLLQILPDHFKYMAHPSLAKTPLPSAQSCPLRELHRVSHMALAAGNKQ